MAYTKTTWTEGVTPLDKTNMDHLETQYDEAVVADAAISVSRPAQIVGTTYQNTTGKALFVAVSLLMGASSTIRVWCDASATPTTTLVVLTTVDAGSMQAVFMVKPSYYYKIYQVYGTTTISEWVEYTLH